MRLAKYLAHAGVASRRAAENLIRAGRVTVDGVVVRDPATAIDERARVAVDRRAVAGPEDPVVYALNKPAGVVCTAEDTHGRPTVVEYVPGDRRVYPVGRLDQDTTGLILLTNDGELANLLTHPRYGVVKTYLATISNPPVLAGAVRALRDGVELEDGRTAPAQARAVTQNVIELSIHEGRKHQVKRMCAAVGHPVVGLHRTRFGTLTLEQLQVGQYRRLLSGEVERLRAAPRR